MLCEYIEINLIGKSFEVVYVNRFPSITEVTPSLDTDIEISLNNVF